MTGVHGMNGEIVSPFWPPLTVAEVTGVLADYGFRSRAARLWRSPRPMSAAALLDTGGARFFVKRHSVLVRSADQLRTEHALAQHLVDRGVSTPLPLRNLLGDTVSVRDGSLYEVFPAATGDDLYRDAMSWTPYREAQHARSAGAALRQFHSAAAGFNAAPRPAGMLMDGCDIVTAFDPMSIIEGRCMSWPGLRNYLAGRRNWRSEVESALGEFLRPASEVARRQAALWTHGDWHPSNLLWRQGAVASVIDLGLSNRTFALHDIAVAIDRAFVSWLEPEWSVDLEALRSFLHGYGPLEPLELGRLLPVVHVDFALSEVEYFVTVTGSSSDANLAWEGYLIGHARWFAGPGRRLVQWLASLVS